MTTNISPFCIVPKDLIGNVSPSALAVWCALHSFADRAGACWPSQSTLAERCGLSDRQIRRCLKELEATGRLTRVKTRGGSDRFCLKLTNTDPGHQRPGGRTICPGGADNMSGGVGHGCPGGADNMSGGVGHGCPTEVYPVNENHSTKPKNQTKPPPPAWAVELADEIRSHVRKQIGKVVQDSQLEKWARALESLTRSRSLDPKPSPEEVASVVRWGINDHEVRGSWAGWAQQILSPPNADKFAKIRAAMNRPKLMPAQVNDHDDYEDRLD
jgi:hypothetical protein